MGNSLKDLIMLVISNYNDQQAIYRWVLRLAGQQLEILRGGQEGTISINEILTKRQVLMQEISQMNVANQTEQKLICQALELDGFCLSNLENQLDKNDFEELQQALAAMGEVLAEINQIDNACHEIMSHSVVGARSKKADPKQAAFAYKNAQNNIKHSN